MRGHIRMVPPLAVSLAMSLTAVAATAVDAAAASLRGSRAAMEQQNRVAKDHALAFYRTAEDIRAAVGRGELVELRGNDDYQVAEFVRYPYAHDAVRLFVERLSAQYREACGQPLVVTSAVRPTTGQPSNAHSLSVHPAGMAVDLRVSDRAACRSWLENALMNLEGAGVLNGIREFHPPHYHVAVFPEQYLAYAAERMESEQALAAAVVEAEEQVAAAGPAPAAPAVVPAVTEAAPRGSGRRAAGAVAMLALVGLPLGRRLLRRGRECGEAEQLDRAGAA